MGTLISFATVAMKGYILLHIKQFLPTSTILREYYGFMIDDCVCVLNSKYFWWFTKQYTFYLAVLYRCISWISGQPNKGKFDSDGVVT